MAAMVEKSMDIPRTGAALAAHLAPARPPVIYGITGVRYEGTQITGTCAPHPPGWWRWWTGWWKATP